MQKFLFFFAIETICHRCQNKSPSIELYTTEINATPTSVEYKFPALNAFVSNWSIQMLHIHSTIRCTVWQCCSFSECALSLSLSVIGKFIAESISIVIWNVTQRKFNQIEWHEWEKKDHHTHNELAIIAGENLTTFATLNQHLKTSWRRKKNEITLTHII